MDFGGVIEMAYVELLFNDCSIYICSKLIYLELYWRGLIPKGGGSVDTEVFRNRRKNFDMPF